MMLMMMMVVMVELERAARQQKQEGIDTRGHTGRGRGFLLLAVSEVVWTPRQPPPFLLGLRSSGSAGCDGEEKRFGGGVRFAQLGH